MKNKVKDLNNILFAQLERLSDEEITPKQLELEIARSKSITEVAEQLINSNKVVVDAMVVMQKSGADIAKMGREILDIEALPVAESKEDQKPKLINIAAPKQIGIKTLPCKKKDPINDCVDKTKYPCNGCLFYDYKEKGAPQYE